jgi:ABC-type transporter Mla MlaB component
MSDSKENAEGLFELDDCMDITVAAMTYERMNDLLNHHKAIKLDGTKIERIDGAGLQLLVAFFKTAETLHISIEWQGYSNLLKKSANLLGLTGELALE